MVCLCYDYDCVLDKLNKPGSEAIRAESSSFTVVTTERLQAVLGQHRSRVKLARKSLQMQNMEQRFQRRSLSHKYAKCSCTEGQICFFYPHPSQSKEMALL